MGTFTLAPGSIDTGLGSEQLNNVYNCQVERWITVYDYGNITRGYALAGYKGTNCCNDVNRAQFATETTIHLYSGVTNSNYSGGSSSFVYNKGIAWGWGTACCQGSCNETKMWDFATETESGGPTMACARTYPSIMTRHATRGTQSGPAGRFNAGEDIEAGYATGGQGGCSQTDKYPFTTGTMTTAPSHPAGSTGQTAWSQGGYSYTVGVSGGGSGSPHSFNHVNESWTSCTFSPDISTITNLAVTCDTHGFENQTPGLFTCRGMGSGTVNTKVISWDGLRGRGSADYMSEWSPVYSQTSAYFLGGHSGSDGQCTIAGKVDCMTDNFSNVIAMDTYSDMAGTCSAAGFQR